MPRAPGGLRAPQVAGEAVDCWAQPLAPCRGNPDPIHLMRCTRLALCLGALLPLTLAFQPRETRLSFDPVADQTLTKTFEQEHTMTLEDVVVTIMGQELELDGAPESVIESSERIVLVDTYGAVEDGRVARLSRTFETLERERTTTNEGEDEFFEESSELEGVVVAFRWEDGEYVAAFGEDFEDEDEDLLEGLWFDADLSGFLPEGEVEEGDTWEPDYQVWRQLNEPGGDLTFLDEDGESTRDELDEELEDNLEGTVECEFTGIREEDEGRVAVIEVTVETEAEGSVVEDLTDEAQADGAEVSSVTNTRTVTIETETEGELLWLIEEGRFLSFQGTGEAEITMLIELEMVPNDGETFLQSQELTFAGELEVEVTFE